MIFGKFQEASRSPFFDCFRIDKLAEPVVSTKLGNTGTFPVLHSQGTVQTFEIENPGSRVPLKF